MMLGCTIVRKKLCGAFQKMKHPHLQAFCILKCLASVFSFLWQVSLEKMKKTIVDFLHSLTPSDIGITEIGPAWAQPHVGPYQ